MTSIKIIHSTIGKDGEHLEANETYKNYDDETAKKLIRLGRAVAVGGKVGADESGEGNPEKSLEDYTKAELVEIAEAKDIKNAARLNKADLIAAISALEA